MGLALDYLPLIHPYPIEELPPAPMTIAMAAHEGRSLPPRCKVNGPLELAEIMAVCHTDNAMPNSLHDALKKSNEYKLCKKSMPALGAVKNINVYRNQYSKHNAIEVNNEILKHGKLLTPGQVLFHGGMWQDGKRTPMLGQTITLPSLLSTSLCPQVAAVHASYHDVHGFLWLITVESSIKTPAFVFNDDGRQNLSHEREVLFACGAEVTCTSIRAGKNRTILEVSLR